jgi:beta-glucosidase
MKMLLPALGLLVSLASQPVLADPTPPLEDKQAFIANLMKQMTLDEKIGQLRLISIGTDMPQPQILKEIAAGRIGGTFNSVTRALNRPLQDAAVKNSRLKIPIFFAFDVVHGYRTLFPISLGQAASWDLDAIARAARTSAVEAAADGVDMTFAPMVDVSRDARWGRSSEGFGEDTYMVSAIARASVHAYQGKSAADADSIMAVPKHFAGYGAVEGGRDYNVVDVSPNRLYQVYLPPYRAAIDAGAGGVMVALSSVNGIPATSNSWLLQDLLRKDWGFKGVTVSDHGAIEELISHGVAADKREAAKLAIRAGIDLSMHDEVYLQQLPELLKSGEINIAEIDNAVREVLGAKYDMGLFKDPYLRIGAASGDPADANSDAFLHRAQAREFARECIVLLENRHQTLPLKKQGTIALIGPMANNKRDMLGSWAASARDEQAITLLQGVRDAVGNKAHVLYARGSNVTDDPRVYDFLFQFDPKFPEIEKDARTPAAMLAEAVRVASQADVIVAAVGESRGMSHESASRTSLDLPANQSKLLEALKATGKPLIVLVTNGRPLALNWESEHADALVETWYTGTEGGHAIADVLFGDTNPSAKLPMTFPRSVGQVPLYYAVPNVGRKYTPGTPSNYTSQYYDVAPGPLYPFGYGLSYTSFNVSDVTLSSPTMTHGGSIEASVNVKNTGERDGATVVQLYLQDVTASIVRPVKELKGFQKVFLKAGEERRLSFKIDENALKFYNAKLQYVDEPGKFNVQIGLDSQTVKQQGFELVAASAEE